MTTLSLVLDRVVSLLLIVCPKLARRSCFSNVEVLLVGKREVVINLTGLLDNR